MIVEGKIHWEIPEEKIDINVPDPMEVLFPKTPIIKKPKRELKPLILKINIKNNEIIEKYYSVNELPKDSRNKILKACMGKNKGILFGYKWTYFEN